MRHPATWLPVGRVFAYRGLRKQGETRRVAFRLARGLRKPSNPSELVAARRSVLRALGMDSE